MFQTRAEADAEAGRKEGGRETSIFFLLPAVLHLFFSGSAGGIVNGKRIGGRASKQERSVWRNW